MAKGRKTGGRSKGTPNKRTQALAEVFTEQGLMIPERIIALLPQLDAREEVKTLVELLQYIYPKRKAVEHSFNPAELNDDELIEQATLAIAHFKAIKSDAE